jgi:tetratricopeptide (TPR) repeat protein
MSGQAKKSFLKRAYINTTARYNYFYNANRRVEESQRTTALAHKDDFDQIVSLFPFATEAVLKSNVPQMEEAIKRCNHIINRKQSSKWVDNAWLTIGKSNFYKGDFFAALEAFEYVASAYKLLPIRYEAELWIIKSMLMLDKNDEAVALTDLMIRDKSFPKEWKTELYLLSAEALSQQGKHIQSFDRLSQVVKSVKRTDFKYRRYFVAGQLAMRNNKPQQAIHYFNKVTRLNPPYEFDFFARINMVRLYSVKPINNPKKAKAILKAMLKDDKNIEYKDQIYFELGTLELKSNNSNQALSYFKKALESSQKNTNLKSRIYLITAELFFEQSIYDQAQLYYDSAVQVLNPDMPTFEEISERHQVLTNLIKNLVIIDLQDSLLRLAESPEFRKKTLESYKEQERKRKEEEEYKKNNPFTNPDPNLATPGLPGSQNQGMIADSRFPFYNMAMRKKGEDDFVRIWGERPLGDFWRALSIAQDEKTESISLTGKEDEETPDEEEKKNVPPQELPPDLKEEDAAFFAAVPFTKEAKEKAKYAMGESYFLAAGIYRDQLQEEEKARLLLDNFERKLPENPFMENAYYMLHKIYSNVGNAAKAEEYLQKLKNKFPKSDFITILENPEQLRENKPMQTTEQKVEQLYQEFYAFYKAGQYAEALKLYDTAKFLYPTNELEGPFDFVYALIQVERKNNKLYLEIMQRLAANYAGTPLGDLALERVQAYNKIVLNQVSAQETNPTATKLSKFKKSDANQEHHFVFLLPKSGDLTMSRIAFSDFNREFRADKGLQITTSFLNRGDRIVIVAGFQNKDQAAAYLKEVLLNTKLVTTLKSEGDKQYFAYISKDNFSILLEEKNWDDYRDFFSKN